MSDIPKLKRFDMGIESDVWYNIPLIVMDYQSNGEYIEVIDLIFWIQTHVREGTISTVYSDLLKALGEGDNNE